MIFRVDELNDKIINDSFGCKYDGGIILILTDSEDYQFMCGRDVFPAYTIKVSRIKCEDWQMSVCDFIDFCEANGQNAVLVMSEDDLQTAKNRYDGHRYNEPFLRENEPTVLIHSTSMDNWKLIKRDGELKSWNRLKSENAVPKGQQPIGAELGDPKDFSNYIMFGGGMTGEIVVNSKQQGKILMDANAEYLTGARLYFNAEKMARDGLLVRDGCHIKVKDSLPLLPYLMWTATWEVLGLESQISTPKIFSELADKKFKNIFKITC